MAVIRNIKVDIPKSHITIERQSGGKPALIKYVLEAPYNREKGYPEPKRTTIGHQCPDDKTKMYPTTQYATVFPDAWEKISGEKKKPAVKRIGMFTLCQAVNTKTGVKDTMDGVFGANVSDVVMDFAMYSILHKTDVVSAFQAGMRGEMLYSGDARSDSMYTELFEHKMTREQILQFRKEWALRCKEEAGVKSVWLCIDGSNDDCRSKGVEIAEKGAAKSKKNVNIISFTYAVTDAGFPVTFDVYEGGMVDAKAMKNIIFFLTEAGILLKGVILDRGYCTKPTIEYLNGAGIPYIIMVKGQPEGFSSIVSEYGSQIKMNAEYLVPGTYLFGVQQKVQLFKSYKKDDYVTLFFDYQNGSERVTALLKNLYGAMSDISSQLRKNDKVTMEGPFQNLLHLETEISEDGQEQQRIKINTSDLQKAIDEKGLYSIVSSEEMPPEEVHRRYASRSASETQYRFIKTQLGYGTLRVQNTQAVYAKFFTAFIASIIRFEIEQASKALGQSATRMIEEACRLEMIRLDNSYTYTHAEKARVTDLFSKLGVDGSELLDETVKAENDRMAGRTPALRHRKPGPKRGSHHKQYDSEGNVIRRKSGVKPGTKRPEVNQDGSVRKKPGVAPGTKRGIYNKDGSLRKKPGPKSHNEVAAGQ